MIIKEIGNVIQTDLSVADMVKFSSHLKAYKVGQIIKKPYQERW